MAFDVFPLILSATVRNPSTHTTTNQVLTLLTGGANAHVIVDDAYHYLQQHGRYALGLIQLLP
jgi:hypothetical protein